MKTPSKDKGKATQLRDIEDVVFSTEMAALDFRPTLQEETLLQLVGLDRFITRVTWDIINTSVVQEVISNLNLDTMESVLNGRTFPIFPKDWRNKMRASFYIATFTTKREPDTPLVRAGEIFSTFKEKMRTKAATCRIADCTMYGAKRPLWFFNSLFLLRTTPSTIPYSTVVHIADALNGKTIDWPALFRENLVAEMKSIKEDLFKDKTTALKTMVGPPLTMLLIADGLLTVHQELDAGILMPQEIIEKPLSKKRKLESTMELTAGKSSQPTKAPQILVAMATPDSIKPMLIQETPTTLDAAMELTNNKSVLISTVENGTLRSHLKPLQDILQNFQTNTTLLQN